MRPLATLLGAALLVSACSGGGEPATISREGSTLVEDEPVTIGELPEAYEITYRIEEFDGDETRVREAVLTVARPFRSRFEVGDEDVLRVAHFAYFGAQEPGDETEVVSPVPSAAPGDVRADVLPLGDGVETREVLGRRCRVHRFGASLLDGLYIEGDLVDACIDGDGLVLEEVTRVEEEVILRRVATNVDLDPAISKGLFELDVRMRTVEEGGGDVREVEPTSSPPGTFWELPDVPAGFERHGRYATIPPQEARLEDEDTRAQFVASVTDVWTRGIDVLTIEQGGTLGRVPPFGDHPHGELVDDIGELSDIGELVLHPNRAELRVPQPFGRFVRLSGTMPGEELVEIARALRPVDGGELVYVNPEEPSGS